MDSDSFSIFGSLRQDDSFITSGSLSSSDSFNSIGSLSPIDSFHISGSLSVYDSHNFRFILFFTFGYGLYFFRVYGVFCCFLVIQVVGGYIFLLAPFYR